MAIKHRRGQLAPVADDRSGADHIVVLRQANHRQSPRSFATEGKTLCYSFALAGEKIHVLVAIAEKPVAR